MHQGRSLVVACLALAMAPSATGCRPPESHLPASSSPAATPSATKAARETVGAERTRWRTYFNEPSPKNGFSDTRLRDQLVAYIDGAVPGSEIRAHVTRLSGAKSMRVLPDSLLAAHDRGVSIQMVHDGDSFIFPKLRDRLGDRYVHCGTPDAQNNTACVSRVDNGTHHIKNWYFSRVELDGEVNEHVVLTSSYNITVTQSRHFNDMLVVVGNQELYDAHVALFDDYRHQRKTVDRYSNPRGRLLVPSAGTYTAEFSPQKEGDMVADSLRNIREYEKGCSLRLANLNLTRSAIIRQLLRIRALGCDVRVVTGTPLTEANETRLNGGGIPTRNVDIDHNGRRSSLHNKMMVYRGQYDPPIEGQAATDRMWVWTGSQNFTARPLRFRDDVFVGISRRTVYDSYSAHFDTIWAAAD